jgi:hypothetical protein
MRALPRPPTLRAIATSRRAGAAGAHQDPAGVMKVLLIVVVLGALLAASVGVSLLASREIGDVDIGWNGTIALALGVGLSCLLGAGLMALMFFSARRGYDDRAHDHDRLRRFGEPPAED